MKRIEPRIHSHITDVFPDDHPLAYKNFGCEHLDCDALLHAGNNECMQTWIETGIGNFCVEHAPLSDVLRGELGLPVEEGGETHGI